MIDVEGLLHFPNYAEFGMYNLFVRAISPRS